MEFVVRPRPRGNMFLPAVIMLLMASGLHAVRIENVTIPAAEGSCTQSSCSAYPTQSSCSAYPGIS